MADLHLDNTAMTVASVAGGGTGTLTLGSAVSGALAIPASADGKTFSVRVTEGTKFETFTAGLYTHSGTTLTRGTIKSSSNGGAAETFTSAAVVEVAALADLGNRVEQLALPVATAAPTTGNVTLAVNTMTDVDISGITAARQAILPAVFAVGDRVGVRIVATHATPGRELILTAGSGDTLEGVAGGTEWSRIWQVGETAWFRGAVANSTWAFERDKDGRIPAKMVMRLTTSTSTSDTAGTFYTPTALSGVWTVDVDVGGCASASASRFLNRRTSLLTIFGRGLPINSISDAGSYTVQIHDGTNTYAIVQIPQGASAQPQLPYAGGSSIAAGSYLELRFRSLSNSAVGMNSGATFVVTEVL